MQYTPLLLVILFLPLQAITFQKLSFQQIQTIGTRIWHNECAGKVSGLTSWNNGENCASLGIGHFIWYPKNTRKVFNETFPELIIFLQKQKIKIPKWLDSSTCCPWNNKKEFDAAQNSAQMQVIRNMLVQTIALQTQFIIEQFNKRANKMLSSLSTKQKKEIEKKLLTIAQIPQGMFALIDYVNFKGDGTSKKERYNNQGWGLLQVLQNMQKTTLPEFVTQAKQLLGLRIKNSPKVRNEQRWLKGWSNRINRYLEPFKID